MIHLPNPEMVGTGALSTKYDVISVAFAGDEVVFARSLPGTLSTRTILCESPLENGKWQPPAVLPFSGQSSDISPRFSADGTRLYFASRRGQAGLVGLWYSTRAGNTWSSPQKLFTPLTDKAHQLGCSEAANGDLVVVTVRDGMNIVSFLSKKGDGYGEPQAMDPINATGYISDACIAPDESYVVFSAIGGADELLSPGAIYQHGDLYISFRKEGAWQKPVHLPEPVNSQASESSPSISPDGKYLYFTSDRNFVLDRHDRPLTYDEIRRQIHGLRNGLSKVFRVPLAEILKLAKG